MKIKFFPLFLCLFLLFGCGGDSEEPMEGPDDDSQIIDEIPPMISRSNLSDIIEVVTDLEISIDDMSLVETKIQINGQEVHSTSERQFVYMINPYPLAVGNAEIRIISEDEFGNISEDVFDMEIKHLLMDFNLGEEEETEFNSNWVFYNDGEGDVITWAKVQPGSNKIYTDAPIEGDQVYYSFATYYLTPTIQQALEVETYTVGLGETRQPPPSFASVDRDESVEVSINRIDAKAGNECYRYFALGENYLTSLGPCYPALTNLENLKIAFNYPTKIYLIPGANFEYFDGKKENFRYAVLEPTQDNPEIVLNETEFRTMDDYFVVDMPPFNATQLNFFRHGFENEADLLNDVNHYIYRVRSASTGGLDYLDIPILEGFEFYRNNIYYTLDEKRVQITQYGNDVDLSMPTWEITNAGISDDTYFIEGLGEVDYFSYGLYKFERTTISRHVAWTLHTFDSGENRTIPVLEFPTIITDEIGDSYFNGLDLPLSSLFGTDFENIHSFSEAMDHIGLHSSELRKDEKSEKTVSFPVGAQ